MENGPAKADFISARAAVGADHTLRVHCFQGRKPTEVRFTSAALRHSSLFVLLCCTDRAGDSRKYPAPIGGLMPLARGRR